MIEENAPMRFGARKPEVVRAEAGPVNFRGFSASESPLRADHSSPGRLSSASSWLARFLDGVATTSLFMIFFGFPLFFLSLSLQGLVFEKQMYFYFWLLLGVIGWVSKGIVTGELRLRRTPVDIPLLLFWGVLGVSSIFSVDKWHSLWGFFGDPSRGFLSITAIVLAYFFIVSHVDARRFQLILGGILLSGTLVALWTALAFFGIRFLPEALLRHAPLSLFGTMKSLTLFFGMLLPLFVVGIFLLFQWFREKTWAFWTLLASLVAGVCLSLYALLAVYAFTPWFPVLAGVSFFLIYILAQVVRLGDRFNWMPMVLFVVVLIFLMIGNQGGAFLSKKTTILPEVGLDLSSSWTVAKEAIKERLVVGSGPATYGYNFSLYKPEELNRGIQNTFRFYQGGNFFLEVLPTVGIVGAFFFLVLVLTVLGVGIVGLSRDKERNKVFSLGMWSAVLVFFVALFRMPIDGPILVYGFLFLALAVAVLIEEGGISDERIHLSLKASPKYALALAFTFMVVSAGVAFLFAFLGKAFLADIHAGRASRLVTSSREVSDDALSLMGRSLALVPYEGRYYATLGQMYMTVVNKEAAKPENERNLDVIKTLVERNAVPLVDEAARRMPNDVLAFEVSGQVYENVSLLAGSDPAVLARTAEVYRRAMALEPRNPNFPLKLGLINRVLANRDDKKSSRGDLLNEAKTFFQSSLDKKKDFIPGYLNLGLTEEALGNTDAAIAELEKALQVGPNVDAQFHLARILQIRGGDDDLNRAEKISLEALRRNDKNVNILLNLGFVYEKKKNKEKAIETYKKLLGVFEGEPYAEARKQVETLIGNVESGKGNLATGNSTLPETPETPPTEIPNAAENVTNTPAVISAPGTTGNTNTRPTP